ncbi:MAG: phytanoyl-CoA dioxygenase [Pedobacter sp.]|nr:MAG: phytanoyl-CoA dioxygenase [Pedobacter sp.]
MAMNDVQDVAPFKESTHLLNDPRELRATAEQDGYLFFKALLPAEAIAQVRKDVFEICKKNEFLKDGTTLTDGIAAPGFMILESSVNPAYLNYYREIQQLHSFHALAHDPNLLKALNVLFDGETLVHPLKILRTIFPQAQKHTTPPHQDYFHVRGTENTWTSWIPLGDCDKELGGLTLVPGSQNWGLLPEHPAEGAGLIGINVPSDSKWVIGEFAAGDVLMFHSHTVHQGIDNNSADRIRLSMDCRFQALSEKKIGPVAVRSPHLHCIDWDGLYKKWPANDPLKYYWKDLGLEIDQSAPPTIGTPENPHPTTMG